MATHRTFSVHTAKLIGSLMTIVFSFVAFAHGQTCPNIMTNSGTLPNGTYITKYTQKFAFGSNQHYCTDYAKTLQCMTGQWIGNQAGLFTGCQNISSGSCFDGSTYTPSLQFITRYTRPTATDTQSCSELQQTYTCVEGNRSGGTIPPVYTNCGGCTLPWTGFLAEGASLPAFSVPTTMLPKSCNDFTTTLTCKGGILNGNWQTYKYPSCIGEQLINGVDIAINESPIHSGDLIAQGSSPEITIIFKNRGDTLVNQGISTPGFLSCTRKEQNLNVYSSKAITSFVVNPGSTMGVNISLKSLFTQSVGVKTLECKSYPSFGVGDVSTNNTWSGTFEVVKADRFDLALSRSINPIYKNLDAAEGAKGTQGVQNFVFNNVMNVLVPLVIIIGILTAILGFYKVMFSSDDSATKEGTRYIIFGVIGIIIIMSAKFIGQNIFDMLWTPQGGTITGSTIASGVYNNIVYPFIKFAIYLVLGAMFVILVTRVITFLFGSDADAQKKAGTLIGWNVISMLIIIGAKQIVEAIYGKQSAITSANITNLGDIGSGILADKNIPLLYQIINYALGIASLVILVIIIIQTVKLLTKPDDPAQIKSIKNSLLYMFIGILVLGAGYLIVNFAIIN